MQIPLEQLLILATMAVFALVHWLARRPPGQAEQPTTRKLREGYPEREPDAVSRVAFEPVEKLETVPQIEPARAPRSVPREHRMREPQRRERSAPVPLAAPLAQRAATRVGLDWEALRPQNQNELRRAMALVVVFGPPRSLDPPS